ncbi:MAG: electron transport complex subunit RsxG, partial [Gammaproteobacteria bacterium]|nr:electron transport complex subunit RsxG [Gammaproteobacteria bacterium]
AALTVSQVAQFTAPQIERNRQLQATRTITAVLPGITYNNEPALDVTEVVDADLLGSTEPLQVYTARQDGRPVAYAITAVAPAGYVGPMRLLVGVAADGSVLAVRALEHRETPGLGDQIERERSAWISVFDGLNAAAASQPDWSLQTDGGRFDQLSGATITSRAVVRAVGKALEFFRAGESQLARVELVTEPDQ